MACSFCGSALPCPSFQACSNAGLGVCLISAMYAEEWIGHAHFAQLLYVYRNVALQLLPCNDWEMHAAVDDWRAHT